MRSKIAAGNWKMNNTLDYSLKLIIEIGESQRQLEVLTILAVPFPYLLSAVEIAKPYKSLVISAQNVNQFSKGAFTGEVSAEMLKSIGVEYCIIGHSERREYFFEGNEALRDKLNILLEYDITPIFCCGEPLAIRKAGDAKTYVSQQLNESLFHLSPEDMTKVIVAYEPIWAIGTGETATPAEAQEIHHHIRASIEDIYGSEVASIVPILYGGSVNAGNAAELFAKPDVDGGLVGGASLKSAEFVQIINAFN
ncbi:MAG: triose-phosphate isomerase [Saprospiraceae bacterium]|nr:triose-phosphate isomerase [Saprospiraceae bacterium]